MSPFVLVPLDGSEHALCALPVARVLAKLEGATLRILHVTERHAPAALVLERLGLTADELVGSFLDVRTGDATDAIVGVARESDCLHVALSTRVGAANAGRTVGPIALRVLRDAPRPVTLVNPERGVVAWDLRRILVPHDGTPTTTCPFGPAAELARHAGAELVILHVAAPGAAAPTEPGALSTPRYVDQPAHEWPSWIREFVERVACLCSLEGLRIRMVLASGSPAAEIVRAAHECDVDLVVLAWRGDWEAGHAVIAKNVVREAHCPIMVLRAEL